MNVLTVGFTGVMCILMLLLVWIINSYFKERVCADRGTHSLIKLPETVFADKRSHPRVEIKWPVKIETAEGLQDAKTTDVSLGGAFVSCAEPLSSGETFNLTIDVPNQEPQTVTAQVIWSNGNVPEDKVVNRGMGIRFIKLSDEARESLNEAISADLDNRYAAISSPEKSAEEQRRHPRVNIKWPVKMETNRGVSEARTRDLSLGGAFISCREPFPMGQTFRLTFEAPDKEPQTVTAEVVWSSSNVLDDRIVNRGMGIRFVEISDEIQQFLNEAISEHPEECQA